MDRFTYVRTKTGKKEYLARLRDGWVLGRTPELFLSPGAAFQASEDWRASNKAAGGEPRLLEIKIIDL